jgi:hypothetical protein
MDIGRDGYWKPHVSNSFALSVPKISKPVTAPKNKLKIQGKRVLGCLKYTHWLVDHNKVTTQYGFFVETCSHFENYFPLHTTKELTQQHNCIYVNPQFVANSFLKRGLPNLEFLPYQNG